MFSFLYIFLQRQNGPGQRVIREVNTTTRACALWGLAEDSDYIVQVRSIGERVLLGRVCTSVLSRVLTGCPPTAPAQMRACVRRISIF